jgi:hypothetical protein
MGSCSSDRELRNADRILVGKPLVNGHLEDDEGDGRKH